MDHLGQDQRNVNQQTVITLSGAKNVRYVGRAMYSPTLIPLPLRWASSVMFAVVGVGV